MKSVFYGAGLLLCVGSAAIAQTVSALSLNDAILLALKNNPELRAEQKKIDAAQGKILQTEKIQNPELSFTYNEVPTNFSFGVAGEKDITLSQEIEFPGKRSTRLQIVAYEKKSAELSHTRLQCIVTAQVKKAYYLALLAKENTAHVESSLKLLSDFLKIVTDRYRAGANTYVDVIRTKVEVARLHNTLTEAKREEREQLGNVKILFGDTGSVSLSLSDSLSFQPLRSTEDSAIELYSRQSTTVNLTLMEIEKNQLRLALAQKNTLPDFSVSVALQNRPGTVSLTGSSTYFGFGIGIRVPIWNWQGSNGEEKEAEALLDLSAIQGSALQQRIRQNIRNAFHNVSAAQEQLRVFDATLLRDAEDELQAGISLYQNNQIDLLNLLDIYRTVREAKREYTRALCNFLIAKAELEASGELSE